MPRVFRLLTNGTRREERLTALVHYVTSSQLAQKLELEQNLIKLGMSREVHTNRKTPGQSTQGAKAQSGTDRERTEMRLTTPPMDKTARRCTTNHTAT